MTAGHKLIMGEIRCDDFDDPWGTATAWAFDIAEVLYVEYGVLAPGFLPSPLMHTREDLDYPATALLDMIDDHEIGESDLMHAYTIIDRYRTWCKIAGKDY